MSPLYLRCIHRMFNQKTRIDFTVKHPHSNEFPLDLGEILKSCNWFQVLIKTLQRHPFDWFSLSFPQLFPKLPPYPATRSAAAFPSVQMSLLDFAASCGVLDLDLDLLAGEDSPRLLAHLFPGRGRWWLWTRKSTGFDDGWLSCQPWITLWLCQNSYWKWPFIVDFPMKNGDFP
jgi:hypothetical protein